MRTSQSDSIPQVDCSDIHISRVKGHVLVMIESFALLFRPPHEFQRLFHRPREFALSLQKLYLLVHCQIGQVPPMHVLRLILPVEPLRGHVGRRDDAHVGVYQHQIQRLAISRLAAILEPNVEPVLQDIRPRDGSTLLAGDASDLLDGRFVIRQSKDMLQPDGVARIIDDILKRFDVRCLAE
ncbi:hypothetical protein VTN77DRAFT_1541 [Rasamsonia byssochlamydoides]|uniref:uncharacterized protein n=1 Tax=Rasamsonia byssochlamydoides TaxID=89139 RepID=UPI003743D926